MNSSLSYPYTHSQPFSNGKFDPFADLMLVQGAKPPRWQTIDLRTLSPFQRALLSIDGTVTKFIEAYSLEPVEITRLEQQEQKLSTEHHWLNAPQGTDVIARQVLLRGKYSTTIYAYAVSLLIPNRLPSSIIQELDLEPAGIGKVLLNSQLENRREVLWYGREQLDDIPESIEIYTGSSFISRTYRIIFDEQPIMLINEKFPAACSLTAQS